MNMDTLTLSRGIPFWASVIVPVIRKIVSQPKTSTVEKTTTRHVFTEILCIVFSSTKIRKSHRQTTNPTRAASFTRLLDNSLETVDERNTHDEGDARNDASDVGEDGSPPPLGGIHLVIFLPTILHAQR